MSKVRTMAEAIEAFVPDGSAGRHGVRARVRRTCEEIVSGEVIRSDPNRTLFPAMLVSAVVHEPWAAHPSPLQGYARRDDAFYIEYHERSRSREGFLAWLEAWVTGVADRRAYLSRLGEARMARLRIREILPAAPVSYVTHHRSGPSSRWAIRPTSPGPPAAPHCST